MSKTHRKEGELTVSDDTTSNDGWVIKPPTIPRTPARLESTPAAPARAAPESVERAPETLGELLRPVFRGFTCSLPQILPRLAIFLGIVVIINVVLMPLQLWTMPRAVASFLKIVIFLTAAYSAIIPKTVFWTIVFIWGKNLLRTAAREGPGTIFGRFGRGFSAALDLLASSGQGGLPTLVAGAGLGITACVYLSSTVTGRSAPAILATLGVVYLLGTTDSLFLSAVHLGTRDLMRFFRDDAPLSEKGVQRLLAACVPGVVLGLLLMLVSATLGYLMGALALLGGVVLVFVLPTADAES